MTTLVTSRQQSDRRWWMWLLLFSLIFLIGVAILALFVFSAEWVQASGVLPASLRSALTADYSADLRVYSFRALQMDVIEEAIRDRERLGEPAGGSVVSTLVIFLQTPVPTITPTGFGIQNPSPTFEFSPTPTLFSLGITPTSLASPTPSFTFVFTPTEILAASAIPTQTPTGIASLPTRTPVWTPTPLLPTPTRVLPSATHTSAPLTPTRTAVPPTSTPVPPTPTPYQPPVDTPPPPLTPYP